MREGLLVDGNGIIRMCIMEGGSISLSLLRRVKLGYDVALYRSRATPH